MGATKTKIHISELMKVCSEMIDFAINHPEAEITFEAQHDPTDVTPKGSDWAEFREGNRTLILTIQETHPKEYYLNKYGIVK